MLTDQLEVARRRKQLQNWSTEHLLNEFIERCTYTDGLMFCDSRTLSRAMSFCYVELNTRGAL